MLEIEGLRLSRPDFSVHYDLTAEDGAFTALVGPSGGGKSTLIDLIAGFLKPDAGAIRFRGQDLVPLAPADRPLSVVFQEDNLFSHLTLAQNLGLGLDPALRLDAAQRSQVEAGLERVGLGGLGPRRPGEVSGGQRQRAALARALIRGRPLLLLDEPVSALDQAMRQEMLGLIDLLRREEGLTVLCSIHTPDDAAGIAAKLVEIREGRIHRQDSAIRDL